MATIEHKAGDSTVSSPLPLPVAVDMHDAADPETSDATDFEMPHVAGEIIGCESVHSNVDSAAMHVKAASICAWQRRIRALSTVA